MDTSVVGERFEVIKFHYKNGESAVFTLRVSRACDLTILDFIQWSYEEDRVFSNNLQNQ